MHIFMCYCVMSVTPLENWNIKYLKELNIPYLTIQDIYYIAEGWFLNLTLKFTLKDCLNLVNHDVKHYS